MFGSCDVTHRKQPPHQTLKTISNHSNPQYQTSILSFVKFIPLFLHPPGWKITWFPLQPEQLERHLPPVCRPPPPPPHLFPPHIRPQHTHLATHYQTSKSRGLRNCYVWPFNKPPSFSVNLLNSENDKHLISPNSTSLGSDITVVRIKEMITKPTSSWL